MLACAVGLAAGEAAPLSGAEVAPAPAAEVSGTVVGPGGEPAAGAVVAVVGARRSEPSAVVVAGADGTFVATVPDGSYALTATHPQWVAAYSPPAAVSGKAVRELRLAAPADGVLLTGEARDSTGAALAGAEVHCLRSISQGDLFVGRADGAGHYALRLPSSPYYGCHVAAGELRSALVEVDIAPGAARKDLDLVIRRPAPAPQAVVDWIRAQAIPLLTPRAGHGFSDLAPLREVVGSARVVALGEATHGSREFFQLKHRLLEYLVSELGFSVFAIEASWPESEAVDEYVRTGQGDPAKALAGLYVWSWNTEEVLDLIRWMRQWNAVPGHRQVRFYGFDVKAAGVSAERLAVRLQQIDPALAAKVSSALKKLAAIERADVQGAKVPQQEYLAAVDAVAEVLPRIAARLPQPASAADRQAIVDQHYVQVLQQYTLYRSGQGEWRDRGMADNVRWIADVAEPGSRLVVWAHNFHVNNFSSPFPWMGGHLEAALGKDYLPVGLMFHHGAFQAMDRTGGSGGLTEFAVGPPLPGTVEDTFERAGWPLCLLDLRRLPPSGPVAAWFRSPQQVRGVGSSFTGEADMAMEVVLPDLVEATTRARPNPPLQP
jgi:erythromycin esterase